MAVTKVKQRKSKEALDEKLKLSTPSSELLEKLAIDCASKPSPNNTFQYAFALSKSDNEAELKYSCTILDGLVKEGYEHQVDCMFGAATALYLLGDFDESRVSLESFSLRFCWFFSLVVIAYRYGGAFMNMQFMYG